MCTISYYISAARCLCQEHTNKAVSLFYIQGDKKSFHKMISNRIPVQNSAHFYSIFLNMSKFDVLTFTDIEMPFTGREKAFCMLEYARSQSNKTVQYAFVR